MGGFRVVYVYANALVNHGHQVTVIHPRRVKNVEGASGASFGAGIWRNIKGLRDYVYTPPVKWQKIDPRVRMLFVPNYDVRYIPDADAIFATAWTTAEPVLSYPATKGERCYLIQGYETWMAPKKLVDETWRLPLHKVVVASWLQELGESFGCHDLTYIPNAVDRERYILKDVVENRPRQVAMMFSTMPVKGSRVGIAALEVVKQSYPDLKVVLFSTCRKQGWVPRWMTYYRNPPQDFIVDSIYNKSSVFLSPSLSEGFPLPPAEAACCGCAVVATDIGGIRDYIHNGVTGLLSPTQDPVALAENLITLLGDEDLRIRLANACRRELASFTWERSAAIMEEFLIRKIGNRQFVSPGESAVHEVNATP